MIDAFITAAIFMVAYVIGGVQGRRQMKREAVKQQKATWFVDDDGNVSFQWKP